MLEDLFVSPYSNPFNIQEDDVSTGTAWDDDTPWVDTDVWED